MSYISIAFAVLRLLVLFLERRRATEYINEGQRQLIAQQYKELSNALTKSMRIEREIQALDDAAVLKRMEESKWLRD